MNYFAHGMDFVECPYRLAGVALPDWLAACDRRARLRRERIAPSRDPRAVEMAEGVRRHLDDDLRFHRATAFLEVSGTLTDRVRALAPTDDRLRAGFWGHVLTEILLDATLIRRDRSRLDAYYRALDDVDAAWVEHTAGPWMTRPSARVADFIGRFRCARFLYGYLTDDALLERLVGFAGRVGLPPLPDAFRGVLPEARRLVDGRASDLLAVSCS